MAGSKASSNAGRGAGTMVIAGLAASGTTEISWRLYTVIILLCKPFAIALYSLGLTVLFQQVLGLWR